MTNKNIAIVLGGAFILFAMFRNEISNNRKLIDILIGALLLTSILSKGTA